MGRKKASSMNAQETSSLRLIHVQGRVVRLEARTRSCCEYDGVESEADVFKLSVEHYHEILQIAVRHSAPL